MTFVRSNNISLKYQRFTTLGSKDIQNRKSKFVAKTQIVRNFVWKIREDACVQSEEIQGKT